MSKENLLKHAKEAKEIWDNKLSKSSKNTFVKFFHIRPTSSGFTIVSTNSEKPMNGNNKINSCSKLEELISICNEELEKENINWNRLGIEGGYKKTEADIQAWLINVINNQNNKFDLYYQELTSALEVKNLYFIGSELIFQERTTKGGQRPDIVAHDGDGTVFLLELKCSKGDSIEEARNQVNEYVKIYQNDEAYKKLLLNYPMTRNLNNIEKYVGIVVVGEKGRMHIEKTGNKVIKIPE